jgi:hypothetical protein
LLISCKDNIQKGNILIPNIILINADDLGDVPAGVKGKNIRPLGFIFDIN